MWTNHSIQRSEVHPRFEKKKKKKLTRSAGSNALGHWGCTRQFHWLESQGWDAQKNLFCLFFQMMWLRHSQKTLVSQSGLGCLLTATGDRRDWGWWWPTEQPFVPRSGHPHPKRASLSIPFSSTSLCNRPAAGLPESTASLSILLSHPAKQPHIQRPFRPLHLPSRFLSLQIWWMTLLQMKQVMFTTVLKEWRGLVNSVFVPAPELILYF